MRTFIDTLREVRISSNRNPVSLAITAMALLSASCMIAPCQTPVSAQEQLQPESNAATQAPATMLEPTATATHDDVRMVPAGSGVLSQGAFSIQTLNGEVKEDQWRQLLVGKTLYLRAGYQENNLEFDEHGRMLGHSPQGSFTLSQIQINKVRLSKHKLELDGDRYGLHFLGAAPYEDPTAATDRVKITSKKKPVRLFFAREEVEKTGKAGKSKNKQKHHPRIEDTEATSKKPSDKQSAAAASETQASQLLLGALDNVLSVGIDERMIASMPDFWKLYYEAAAAKADYRPTAPGVLRQNAVEQKARLISALDPPSNEFAQANGVAGMALYHAVVGSDGKVEEVVAGRPIGFGLDESAEQSIRKAIFQPAIKEGKPVPVVLDLIVSFRIYSKRTSQKAPAETSQKPDAPVLPGLYTMESETTQAANAVH